MISQITLLIILIIINAFFAATEIAFISINDIKFKSKANDGNRKTKLILSLINRPSSFLATIQIGITLAGFLSSAFASEAFSEILAPYLHELYPLVSLVTWNTFSIVIITIILSVFMLIFGELIPKRIALKHYEKIAYLSVDIINIIEILFKPFVFFLTKITNSISKLFGVKENEETHITEEEIRLIVNQGFEKGAIKKYEQNLINNVLEFNDIKVSEIMVPISNLYALDNNLTVEEAMLKLTNSDYMHNKIPLQDENKNITGILYIKDLYYNLKNSNKKLNNISRELLSIKDDQFINVAFNKMKKSKVHVLLVKKNNENLGMVFMRDLLEEIVGNIEEKDI